MNENQVVIYSNGIADFHRSYEISAQEPRKISIPVRQDHLADVLASFNVYGNVTLESPPTFRPANELEGNITIDPQRVVEDMATKLSGARVEVERPGGKLEGTLLGLHQEQEAGAGEPIQIKSLIVLTAEGIRRCPLREVQSFKFLDADVQTEIDKALQRNYQRIKPNSTFVELALSTEEEKSDAIVQYTIPAAAWKISYRLRLDEEQPTELQGFAIVDNNTDEDWLDFQVCVVTGEPITFSTDLADSKVPARKHKNLVSETAQGAVEVADYMSADLGDDTPIVVGGAGGGDEILMAAEGVPAGARMKMAKASSMSISPRAKRAQMQTATTQTTEVQEVGDFSVFHSDAKVSIPAKRSTVIPVFQAEVADAERVLHYKHENHAERPYRSVDFKNQNEFSLGRGVCTVFEEGTYAGSCIVPALKPGESRLLPHALETGAKVRREIKRQHNKIVSLRLSEGFCYTSTRQRRSTHYHITNSRDQEFKLVLDHVTLLTEPKIEARLQGKEIDEAISDPASLEDGVRYTFKLAPKASVIFKVTEERIDSSKAELITHSKQDIIHIHWLQNNIVKTNGPLANDPGVQEALAIQTQLDTKRDEISHAVKETDRLAQRQERLRKNIKSGGQDELTGRWRTELDEAEQAIRRIEDEEIPGLREEETMLRAKLIQTLKSLAAEWSEPDTA